VINGCAASRYRGDPSSLASIKIFAYIDASILIDMNNILLSLKAVADSRRSRILALLADEEACVCELMPVFGMAQSKLSHHLIILRKAGFLRVEKRGKWNYYRIVREQLSSHNEDLLSFLLRTLADDPAVKRDRGRLEKIRKQMNICC
jgi:ArsR family transcriptional regulator